VEFPWNPKSYGRRKRVSTFGGSFLRTYAVASSTICSILFQALLVGSIRSK
jgi:hypothetical protein